MLEWMYSRRWCQCIHCNSQKILDSSMCWTHTHTKYVRQTQEHLKPVFAKWTEERLNEPMEQRTELNSRKRKKKKKTQVNWHPVSCVLRYACVRILFLVRKMHVYTHVPLSVFAFCCTERRLCFEMAGKTRIYAWKHTQTHTRALFFAHTRIRALHQIRANEKFTKKTNL